MIEGAVGGVDGLYIEVESVGSETVQIQEDESCAPFQNSTGNQKSLGDDAGR